MYSKRFFSWFKQKPFTEIHVLEQVMDDYSLDLSEKVRCSMSYPKTTSLVHSIPPRVSFDKGLQSEELPTFIHTEKTLKSLCVTLDVILAVMLLTRFEKKLLSSQVDMIQIYKGGMLIFRICNNPNMKKVIHLLNQTPFEQKRYTIEDLERDEHLDRSIQLNVDYLKSSLYEYYSSKRQTRYEIGYYTAIVVLLCAIGASVFYLQVSH
jgi:hypothetical protein